jgi:hypothetical protein
MARTEEDDGKIAPLFQDKAGTGDELLLSQLAAVGHESEPDRGRTSPAGDDFFENFPDEASFFAHVTHRLNGL